VRLVTGLLTTNIRLHPQELVLLTGKFQVPTDNHPRGTLSLCATHKTMSKPCRQWRCCLPPQQTELRSLKQQILLQVARLIAFGCIKSLAIQFEQHTSSWCPSSSPRCGSGAKAFLVAFWAGSSQYKSGRVTASMMMLLSGKMLGRRARH
jgi:hypothetical protein